MIDFNVIDGTIIAMVGIYCVIYRQRLAQVIYAYKKALIGIQADNKGYTKYVFFSLGVFFIAYGSSAVLHITQFR